MTRPLDTSGAAFELQVEAYRAMSPEHRLRLAESMSLDVRSLAAAGIRRRHPDYSAEDVAAALADLLIGSELEGTERRRPTVPR